MWNKDLIFYFVYFYVIIISIRPKPCNGRVYLRRKQLMDGISVVLVNIQPPKEGRKDEIRDTSARCVGRVI